MEEKTSGWLVYDITMWHSERGDRSAPREPFLVNSRLNCLLMSTKHACGHGYNSEVVLNLGTV